MPGISFLRVRFFGLPSLTASAGFSGAEYLSIGVVAISPTSALRLSFDAVTRDSRALANSSRVFDCSISFCIPSSRLVLSAFLNTRLSGESGACATSGCNSDDGLSGLDSALSTDFLFREAFPPSKERGRASDPFNRSFNSPCISGAPSRVIKL